MRSTLRSGFTMAEIAVIVGLISILATLIFLNLSHSTEDTRLDRARAELTQIADAAHQYIIENKGALPPDQNRSIPAGFEKYLAAGTWPDPPWPGSVYDWDVYPDPQEGPNFQISIRFCPLNQPSQCRFPDEPWAKNFDYYSSVYFCIAGHCKAHPNMPETQPGYCLGGCG